MAAVTQRIAIKILRGYGCRRMMRSIRARRSRRRAWGPIAGEGLRIEPGPLGAIVYDPEIDTQFAFWERAPRRVLDVEGYAAIDAPAPAAAAGLRPRASSDGTRTSAVTTQATSPISEAWPKP